MHTRDVIKQWRETFPIKCAAVQHSSSAEIFGKEHTVNFNDLAKLPEQFKQQILAEILE